VLAMTAPSVGAADAHHWHGGYGYGGYAPHYRAYDQRGAAIAGAFLGFALGAIALPFIGNFTGWVFTEMGRQPWVVFGLLQTNNAASPSVGAVSVWVSFIGFTLLYGVLGVIGVRLVMKHIRGTGSGGLEADTSADTSNKAMAF